MNEIITGKRRNAVAFSPSSAHLIAGASGGLATALITSPLDVLRTRLQSSTAPASNGPAFLRPFATLLTTIKTTYTHQGPQGFFTGLLPSLSGVIPATATKLSVYGGSKPLFASAFDLPSSHPAVHAAAAMAAGIATATITNPLWLVKTRLQLPPAGLPYAGTWDCIRRIAREEGLRAFWRGCSASYVGSVETVVHLVLYEELKTRFEGADGWWSAGSAAGLAKAAAVGVAYPHEVVRTRMREAPRGGKVLDFVGTLRQVWRAERWAGLYGGFVPHVLRSIPSAMISLGVYEAVLARLTDV